MVQVQQGEPKKTVTKVTVFFQLNPPWESSEDFIRQIISQKDEKRPHKYAKIKAQEVGSYELVRKYSRSD